MPGHVRRAPPLHAVDRTGRAWIGYDNGVIAHASVNDARCTSSSVKVERIGSSGTFGMGFAPTPKGAIGGETLFLSTRGDELDDVPSPGVLARVDDGTDVAIAGTYPASMGMEGAELSSRADGRLFAFFASDPFVLAEIDPESAAVRWQRNLEGIRFSEDNAGSWAFSAVGSEFFFFWSNGLEPSKVTRLGADGSLERLVADAGIVVVGAGASTCASRVVTVASRPAFALAPPALALPEEKNDSSATPALPQKPPAKKATRKPSKRLVVPTRPVVKTPAGVPPAKPKRRWPSLFWWLS